MWAKSRQTIAEFFFKDFIELFEVELEETALGEEVEVARSLGTVSCNIENAQNIYTEAVSGVAVPQSLRISLPKDTPLLYDRRYKVRIVDARIAHDVAEWWKVVGFVEGQISTVVTVQREVSI